MRRALLFLVGLLLASAAWPQTATVLYKEQVDTISDLNTVVTDATVMAGTAGSDGNCAEWLSGELIDSGGACGAGSADTISEGDSNVEVVDAGTGDVQFDLDGSQVGSWKAAGLCVGCTSANDDLHVTGAGWSQAIFQSSDSAGGFTLKPDVGDEWELQAVPSDTGAGPPNGIIFYNRTNTNYGLAMAQDGSVGIGDTTPDYPLDVEGDAYVAEQLIFETAVEDKLLLYSTTYGVAVAANEFALWGDTAADFTWRQTSSSGTEAMRLDLSTGNLTLTGTVDGKDIAACLGSLGGLNTCISSDIGEADSVGTGDLDDNTDTPTEGQLVAVASTTTEIRYVKPPPITKTLFNPDGLAATDDVPDIHIWSEPVIVTDVRCIQTGGTNLVVTLEDDAGNDLTTSCTATTSLVDCTLTANTAFIALERLDWATVSVSGTPTSASCFIEYKYDL